MKNFNLIKHWSNCIFFDDLSHVLKNNVYLFNVIIYDEIYFNVLLKLNVIYSIIDKVNGYRNGSVLVLAVLKELINLEVYKKYQTIKWS